MKQLILQIKLWKLAGNQLVLCRHEFFFFLYGTCVDMDETLKFTNHPPQMAFGIEGQGFLYKKNKENIEEARG